MTVLDDRVRREGDLHAPEVVDRLDFGPGCGQDGEPPFVGSGAEGDGGNLDVGPGVLERQGGQDVSEQSVDLPGLQGREQSVDLPGLQGRVAQQGALVQLESHLDSRVGEVAASVSHEEGQRVNDGQKPDCYGLGLISVAVRDVGARAAARCRRRQDDDQRCGDHYPDALCRAAPPHT